MYAGGRPRMPGMIEHPMQPFLRPEVPRLGASGGAPLNNPLGVAKFASGALNLFPAAVSQPTPVVPLIVSQAAAPGNLFGLRPLLPVPCPVTQRLAQLRVGIWK
ncbi:unnamed protein product [Gongylonema pulchrum]|uniref:PPE-SVP domain-containing protein n=1 Tax=Gongylonema pulchrum TaxID=637853 RepID=A0A183EGA9_9BILA|nr:unnamed protein product [Gongylonema pulchrum]